MAAEIAAASAVCACLAAGASLSRPGGLLGVGKHLTPTDEAGPDGLRICGPKDAAAEYAVAGQRSDPIATSLQRERSVLDILEGRWFGSVSSNSSGPRGRLHDSAGSMSPQERRQRLLDVASGHELRGTQRPTSAGALSTQSINTRYGGASGGSSGSSGRSRGSSGSRQIMSAHKSSHAVRPPSPVLSQPDTPELGTMSGNVSPFDNVLAAAAANDRGDATDRPRPDASAAEGRQHGGFRPHLGSSPAADMIGTWAVRQKHFPQAAQAPRAAADPAKPSDGNNAGGQTEWPQLLPPRQQPPHAQARAARIQDDDADDEDRVAREKAWRWRFGRRWAAEQAKQFDPNYGKQPDDDDDGWDAALGYLDACGTGFNLQIGRTISVDKTLNQSSLSRDGSSSFMLLDESVHDVNGLTPRGSVEFDATRSLGNMARKAQTLLDEQKKIDTDVTRQWGDARAAGVSWAGQFLQTVSIDMHGQFGFVLLRAVDRSGAHKLLVRGRAGATDFQLLQAARQEATKQAKVRQVPHVSSIEIVGSGRMEWSRERDRCINVSHGRIVSAAEGTVRTHQDVARLAGALTSCTLPMNYRVMVEGQRLI